MNLKAMESGERIEVGVLGVSGRLTTECCSNVFTRSGAWYPRREELHRHQGLVRPKEFPNERNGVDPHVRVKTP